MSNSMQPLFSVAILSYNNYRYIKEALDSVFSQTYPNIELLISNDASPDFNMCDLTEYINENKKENITHVYLNDNRENVGTVKNINSVMKKTMGEYVFYLAADDALYDKHVLQKFANKFQELGEEGLVLSAKTAMCGQKLNEVISIEPSEQGIKAIKEFAPKKLLSRLSHTFTIPTTSTCYRKSVYKIIGEYDEDYCIIEDAPMYMRLAQKGVKIHWVDGIIAAKHRDGGISHGSTLNSSEGYRKYRLDEITFFNKEVVPNRKNIEKNDYKKAVQKYEWLKNNYFELFVKPNMTKREKFFYKAKNAPTILFNMLIRFAIQIRFLLLNKEVFTTIVTFAILCQCFIFLKIHFWVDFYWFRNLALTIMFLQLSTKIICVLYNSVKFVVMGK